MVNRRELLRFMNGWEEDANGHHTALISFLGEPLAIGLILHYLRQSHGEAACVSTKVTTGKRRGPRLDAWISLGDDTLYQTEIKMWGGNAIGGVRVLHDDDLEHLDTIAMQQWQRWLWNAAESSFYDNNVKKVLEPMIVPSGYEGRQVNPLLCLWWPVKHEVTSKAWFTVPVSNSSFTSVQVFSLTRYLMELNDELLELELPLIDQRLNWLRRILPNISL